MPADAPSKLARIGLANSTALRRHFVELTRAVLEPFSPYCRGNGPPPGQVCTACMSASAIPLSVMTGEMVGWQQLQVCRYACRLQSATL